MEIKITTKQMLTVLEVLSWIIFLGLCVEAGGIIVNTFFTLAVNPASTKNFWSGAEFLTNLHNYDRGHFFALAFIMIIVAILRALMFYLIVKLFTHKKLNFSKPFSLELRRFLLSTACLALGVSFFSQYGFKYAGRFAQQGLGTPDLQALNMAGADVWLFMAVVLFVIAQIVKRGIEIQNENDLTV